MSNLAASQRQSVRQQNVILWRKVVIAVGMMLVVAAAWRAGHTYYRSRHPIKPLSRFDIPEIPREAYIFDAYLFGSAIVLVCGLWFWSKPAPRAAGVASLFLFLAVAGIPMIFKPMHEHNFPPEIVLSAILGLAARRGLFRAAYE